MSKKEFFLKKWCKYVVNCDFFYIFATARVKCGGKNRLRTEIMSINFKFLILW
mgnify:CR=1 FL=1